VVETFDWSNALGAGVIEAMGFPAKNKAGWKGRSSASTSSSPPARSLSDEPASSRLRAPPELGRGRLGLLRDVDDAGHRTDHDGQQQGGEAMIIHHQVLDVPLVAA